MVRRKRTAMLFTSFNPLVPELPCPFVSATPRQYFMAWARTESGTANPRFVPPICVLVWHCRRGKCRIANGSSWRTNIFQIQHTAYNSFRSCSNCAERSCLTECPFFGDIVSRKCADILNAFFVITPIPEQAKLSTLYTSAHAKWVMTAQLKVSLTVGVQYIQHNSFDGQLQVSQANHRMCLQSLRLQAKLQGRRRPTSGKATQSG